MTLEQKVREWHKRTYIWMVTAKYEAEALAETEKQIDMLIRFAKHMGLRDDVETPV